MLWCLLALLLAKATTQPIDVHSTTPVPIQQHAAPPPQPTAAPMAPDAGDPALPIGLIRSAERGELHAVVEWLGEGGSVDAVCPVPTGGDGEAEMAGMLHVAAVRGQLVVVRELLKRGASVDTCRPGPASVRSWLLQASATTPSCSSCCSTRPTLTTSPTTARPP